MRQILLSNILLLAVQAIWNFALLGKHDFLSQCKLEVSNDLYALECLNTTSGAQQFSIFDSESNQKYVTIKAIKAARAVEDENGGISFVEVQQTSLNTQTQQRVVQANGRVFTSTLNIPKQTFRLTDPIDIQINAEMTSIIFNSSTTISKGNRRLSYDFVKQNSTNYLFVACTNDNQTKQNQKTQCDFYDARLRFGRINELTPLFRNKLEKTCAQTVRISKNYLVTTCQNAANYTVTLFALSNQTYEQIFSIKTATRDRIELFEETSIQTAVVFYQASFLWQGVTLNCINTIEVVFPQKSNKANRHFVLHTEKRYFYESHATDLKSLHSLELRKRTFYGTDNPSVTQISKSAGTLDDFDFDQVYQRIIISATNGLGQAVVLQQSYLAFFGYQNQTEKIVIPTDQFIDFNQTYRSGAYATQSCRTISSIQTRDWNAIQALIRCSTQDLSLMRQTPSVFYLQANSFELDGFGCAMDQYVQMTKTGPVCRLCGSNCASCDMAQNSCTSCLFGLEVKNGLCGCGIGLYFDTAQKTCKNCPKNCNVCVKAGVCQECDGTTILNQSQLCQLKKCSAGQFFDKSGEIWSCRKCEPDEYVLVDTCTKCDKLCSSCKQNDQCNLCKPNAEIKNGKCECRLGFFYDQASNQCLQCSQGCQSCVDANTCNVCEVGFLKASQKCLNCESNQYVDIASDSCKLCGFSCSQCDQYAPTCSQCEINSSFKENECVCDPGFWSDQISCQKCAQGCDQCTNDVDCQACKPNFYLVNNECKECLKNQFFAEGQCKDCNQSCLTCTDETLCSSCPIGQALNKGTCITCPDQQKLNPETGLCEPCGFICLSCTAQSCQECVLTTKLEGGNCVCLAAHFKIDDQNKCQSCGPNCTQCSQANACQVCEQGFLLDGSGCIRCNSNEFLDGQKCTNCGVGCSQCNNATNCNICATGMTLIDGKCVCPARSYFDLQTCKECHATCASCNSASEDCLQCIPGLQKVGSKCIDCKVGSFIKDEKCQQCSQNCAECSNDTGQCLKCSDSFIKSADGLSCTCPSNAYPEDGKCSLCNSTCSSCVNQLSCLTCADTNAQPDKDGKCCAPSFFYNPLTQNCQACQANCKSCTESASQCNSCHEGAYLDNKICLPCLPGCQSCKDGKSCSSCKPEFMMGSTICVQCEPGQRIVGDKCEAVQCSSGCTSCLEGPLKCSECKPEMLLSGQICTCQQKNTFFDAKLDKCIQCPQLCGSCINQETCTSCISNLYDLKDGKCISKTCKGATYLDEDSGECINCPDGHLTCNLTQGKLVALSCKPDFIFSAEKCLKCATNQIFIEGKCQDCSSKCQSCTNSLSSCTACAPGLYFDNEGECQCPIGLYFNQTRQRCQLCTDGCLSCSDQLKCLVCAQSKVLFNGLCQNELSCKPGYFADRVTNTCFKCPQNCLSCTSAGACTSCESPSLMTPSSRCIICSKGEELQGEFCQAVNSAQRSEQKTTMLVAIVLSVVIVIVIVGAIGVILFMKKVFLRNSNKIATVEKATDEERTNKDDQIELPQLRRLTPIIQHNVTLLRTIAKNQFEDSKIIEKTQEKKKARVLNDISHQDIERNELMIVQHESNRQSQRVQENLDQLPEDASIIWRPQRSRRINSAKQQSENSPQSANPFNQDQNDPERQVFQNNFLAVG